MILPFMERLRTPSWLQDAWNRVASRVHRWTRICILSWPFIVWNYRYSHNTIPFESTPDADFRCFRFYVHQATVLDFRTLKQWIKIPRMPAKNRFYHDSTPDLLVAVNFRRVSIHQMFLSQDTGSLGYRPDFCDCLVDSIQKQATLYPVPNSRVGVVTVLNGLIAGE